MRILSIIVLVLFAVSFANSAEISVYKGETPGKDIKVSGVGAGTAVGSTDIIQSGSNSIKITTKGPYSGGRIIFAQPVDVSSVAGDDNYLMNLSLYRTDLGSSTSGSSSLLPIRNLRMVIVMDDNKKMEAILPLPMRRTTSWVNIGVPFKAFKGFADSSKKISEIRIFSDTPSTFYIGEIRVISDTTPITVEAKMNDGISTLRIPKNEAALLWASANGGSTLLKYTWDLDSADGIQEEMEGSVVDHMFRLTGTFTITVTVSDVWGIKAPATATVSVTVE